MRFGFLKNSAGCFSAGFLAIHLVMDGTCTRIGHYKDEYLQ